VFTMPRRLARCSERADAQNAHIWTALVVIGFEPMAAQSGGDMRLAPTGASYRVSPGSWPGFAWIAGSARLSIGPTAGQIRR
jgi:hypothetical protein